METIKEVWSGILDYLHNLDDISEVAYNVWITCIEPRTIEDGEVVVFVHTNFQKKIVSEHYADKLKDAFENVLGIPLGLKIVSGEDLEKNAAAAPPPASGNLFDGSTDQDYSFENFVVGSSNKFAHAASQAVASKRRDIIILYLYTAAPDWEKPTCSTPSATRFRKIPPM